MKFILFLLLFIFTFSRPVYSYTDIEMEECISSALSNPATQSITKDSITNYCDCALQAIIDEKRDIRESGYNCAVKNFN